MLKQRKAVVVATGCSENRKIGPVAATYVSQASCPRECPFRGNGCYAEDDRTGWQTARLNRSEATDPVRIAKAEADAIDGLPGWAPLRLHVVGDCRTPAAARIVAAAVDRYTRRGGGRAWTYTHAWRTVRRADWGSVSVLASCETVADVRRAMRRGYAAALVVPEHPADGRAYPLPGAEGLTVIPCPQQTRAGVTCATCRLCQDDTRLMSAGQVIGFAAHGGGARKVRFALEVLNS